MPLFGKKKKDTQSFNDNNQHSPKKSQSSGEPAPIPDAERGDRDMSREGNGVPQPQDARRVKYSFHCQLAHGSPTGIISGFSNVKQLYEKIGECYDIDPSEVRYCTKIKKIMSTIIYSCIT